MANQTIARSGRIYATQNNVLSQNQYLIADFRGELMINPTFQYVDWFGQNITRQDIKLIKIDFPITITDIAYNPCNLGNLLNIDSIDTASVKAVSDILQGATEATLTTVPGSDTAWQDNEQVVVSDETGYKKEGYIDGIPSDTTVQVDNGSGAIVNDIELVGVQAHLNGTTQYFTRADNNLFDIGNAEDYSVALWFKRDRDDYQEVLIAKTNSATGTAYGTSAGWVLYLDASGYIVFAVNDGVDAYIIKSTSKIIDNKYHHIAITFDEDNAANCKIYLDGYNNTGDKIGTLANIGDCSNSIIFAIGAESDGGYPFGGYIRDVAVFDNALLSAGSILTYATMPLVEPGTPTGWWKFTDATSVTTIQDVATANNVLHLTLVGGTTTNYGTHSRYQKAYISSNLLGFDWGMENGNIGGWAVGDAASILRKNKDNVKYGQQTLCIRNDDASQAFSRSTIATITGNGYHFQGWFKTPATPNNSSQLVNVDLTASKGVTVLQAGATTANTWHKIEFDFEAGDTSTTIDLGAGCAVNGEQGYWENVQIFDNLIDAPGMEDQISVNNWATTGTPTVDDQSTSKRSGTYCYKVNGNSSNYVTQTITVVAGEVYKLIGHIKCGSANKGMIILSGACSASLDNDTETTNYKKISYEFTAATTSLIVKIYGDGADAYFDDFALIKPNYSEYHFDKNMENESLQFLYSFIDSDGKKNQIFLNECKASDMPISFSNIDYTTHNLTITPVEKIVIYKEN